jgi:predicted nucleic acid-binding Zn ribbon protein
MSTWRPSGPPPGERDPLHVSESLGQVTRRLGGANPEVLATLFSRWEVLVGPEIAAHCQPVSVRRGVLDLLVDQPAWASQIRFMAGEILAALADSARNSEVTDIRVRVSDEDPARPPHSRR